MADILVEFTARTSDAGRAWVLEYQRHCHVLRFINSAFDQIKQSSFTQASASLSAAATILATQEMSRSVNAVLSQFYHKTHGLYLYRKQKLDEARSTMRMAHSAIAGAISEEDFLAPFALQCPEICMNEARVARNQRDWDSMHGFLDQIRAMIKDEIPLCTTHCGVHIYYSKLRSLFYSVSQEGLPVFDQLCTLMEDGPRMVFYDKLIRNFLHFENSAINYEPKIA